MKVLQLLRLAAPALRAVATKVFGKIVGDSSPDQKLPIKWTALVGSVILIGIFGYLKLPLDVLQGTFPWFIMPGG
jgi:hypothetical protein